jgi:hypothetical protein
LPNVNQTSTLQNVIADEIKELMQAQPFRPIRIVMGDKHSYVVAHTDYLMISPDRLTVHFYDERGQVKIVNAQQIRLVEPLNRRSPKAP